MPDPNTEYLYYQTLIGAWPLTVERAQGYMMKAVREAKVRVKVNGAEAWLTSANLTPTELAELLHEHITKVVTHYRGKVFAWDVVNEAFDERGKVKPSIWYDQPGIGLAEQSTAYIEQAFRWAHAADPEALLFYNDAEGETVNAKSDAIYRMVQDFKRRGVTIDGVGLQMHIFDLRPDVDGIEANIARFTALDVQVQITEMDVALPLDGEGGQSKTEGEGRVEPGPGDAPVRRHVAAWEGARKTDRPRDEQESGSAEEDDKPATRHAATSGATVLAHARNSHGSPSKSRASAFSREVGKTPSTSSDASSSHWR